MAGSPDGFKRMRSILSKISGEGQNGNVPGWIQTDAKHPCLCSYSSLSGWILIASCISSLKSSAVLSFRHSLIASTNALLSF